MTNFTTSDLTTLLPSTTYTLGYSLPLLFISVPVTFAGAFLTLDRTRSFPPAYDAIPGAFDLSKKRQWILEGGLGGLAAGFAFGVHSSTFLALLIPAISPSSSLSSKSFLAVWVLSSVVTTVLAGRWKYIALGLTGLSGGALFALALSVIIHPTLLTRIVLISICAPILTLLVLLPIPRTQHTALRFAASATGAFGLVLAIALLAAVPAWANVWDRLWLPESPEWGTASERGLSSAFCLFLAAGAACDWALKRQFGECPDQKWDTYLADYAARFPNNSGRAGTFQPLASFWDRLVHPSPLPASKDIIFPINDDDDDDDAKIAPLGKLQKHTQWQGPGSEAPSAFRLGPEFLKKGRTQSQARFLKGYGRKRAAPRFRPDDLDLSSDEDADDASKAPLSPVVAVPVRPWLKHHPSSDTSTTLNGDDAVLDYSDYEQDLGKTDVGDADVGRGGAGWSPGFLRRHQSAGTQGGAGSTGSATVEGGAPMAAVPATPSLIKALDRIAVAQKDAFGAALAQPTPHTPERRTSATPRPGLPPSKSSGEGGDGLLKTRFAGGEQEGYKGEQWGDFWRDVRAKAQAG